MTPGSEAYDRLIEELLEEINLGRSLDELLDTVYDRLQGIVPYNRIAVALVQPGGDKLRLVCCRSDGPEALRIGYEDDIAGSTLETLLRTTQPRILNDLPDYLDHKPSSRSTRLIVREGMRANLTLPLVAGGRPVGVVFFSNREAGVYREEHARLLKRLAGHIAISVEKTQLIETLRTHNQALHEANELKARFVEKLQEEVERRTAELSQSEERYRLAYQEIVQLKARLEQENVYLRDEIKTEHDVANLVGASRALAQVRQAIEQVARTDSTVLIIGETGTGKELIARAIHELSPRQNQLLVKVNCAALAPGLIASELFGHEAGAFTGAVKRRLGRFELAHRGSIFLDEIAEIPPETQVLLLRVLQERVLERVGGSEPVAVDVRILAATNRDLQAAVAEGGFRPDLFYRLNVFPIRVPPLRERREDIPALIEHFIRHFERRMNKHIVAVSRRSMDLLTAYSWPGNVRELENLVERAMIVSHGDTLEVDPTWLSGPVGDGQPETRPALAELERRTILETLERCGGKIYGPGGAAEVLGLKPTTLYGKMRKHRIRKRSGSLRFE
ncbi:MAG TPA: sigma-54-dependent Fis family transcriptional regulator [Gemmataceae bacterium]|nr:sigma-54-dependent Fis family transcriptional regulator [Gemmataceae bacterium]